MLRIRRKLLWVATHFAVTVAAGNRDPPVAIGSGVGATLRVLGAN